MTYYEFNGNCYAVGDDGIAHPLTVTAKDKVIEVRELESITPKVGEEVVTLPSGAHPITLDEIVRKFNLSQKNPVQFTAEAPTSRKTRSKG